MINEKVKDWLLERGFADRLTDSAAPDVATVDQDGKVTAVAKGKAPITPIGAFLCA